jgi:hypothetical protein
MTCRLHAAKTSTSVSDETAVAAPELREPNGAHASARPDDWVETGIIFGLRGPDGPVWASARVDEPPSNGETEASSDRVSESDGA